MNNIFITSKTADYELLDSGNGRKLERYGEVVLSRPDPQSLWSPSLSSADWKDVSAVYEQSGAKGKWNVLKSIPDNWSVSFGKISFNLSLLPSKHIGVFPEQSSHWNWLKDTISQEIKSGRKISVLNLFGYTGGASLACASVGAEVCHIDGSQFAVTTASRNRDSSNLSSNSIRFIVDDVRKFVEREIKRGKKYDIIIMDPPVYGKGAKKEVWKIEEDLYPFLTRVQRIVSKDPVAIIVNGYASTYSHITYANILSSITKNLQGQVISGELAVEESFSKRLLPIGIFARWSK